MIILDGAHNFSKVQATVKTLKNLTYKKLYLIIALTHERNPKDIFKNLIPLADYLFITRYQSKLRRCFPPKELAKKIKFNGQKEIFLEPDLAFAKAKKLAGKNDLILVTGSLYLAGEIRQQWRPEKKILIERKI